MRSFLRSFHFEAGFAVLVSDMRGYGEAGTVGYDARALAEEFRALVHQIVLPGCRRTDCVGDILPSINNQPED